MGTLQWRGWKAKAPIDGRISGVIDAYRRRHRRRRGVDSEEGCIHHSRPRRTSWAPPSGSGAEPRPKTNLVTLLLRVLYWWQLCSTTRWATANRSRVSIRVATLFGHGCRWHDGQPCNNFCLMGYILIMQNLVTVSHIVCAHVPRNFQHTGNLARNTPLPPCWHAEFGCFRSSRVGASGGFSKIWKTLGPAPLWWRTCMTLRNTTFLHICYTPSFVALALTVGA